jgi:hypothetical protein
VTGYPRRAVGTTAVSLQLTGERAEEFLALLDDRLREQDGFIAVRDPDPQGWVRVLFRSGMDQRVAEQRVIAALDGIHPDWSAHLALG